MSFLSQIGQLVAQNALRVLSINPAWSRYFSQRILNLTNIATNTTAYQYFDLRKLKYWSLHGVTSGTTPTDVLTCTIELAFAPGDDATSLSYEDMTDELFGVTSWVDTDFVAINDKVTPATWGRLKYVTSNDSGNDCDLTAYLVRLY